MKNKREIIVIGSGISGYAAAVTAKNASTVVRVIDRAKQPGGQATHVNVGTICGLFQHSEWINHPFLRDFVAEYMHFDASSSIHTHSGYKILSYNWRKMIDFFENKFNEQQIHFYPDHEVIDVRSTDKYITEVTTKSKLGNTNFDVDAIIDCTGNALISNLLNSPLIQSQSYQSPAYIFELRGVDSDDEFKLNMVLARFCQKFNFAPLFVVPGSLNKDKVALKLALQVVGSDNCANMTEILTETKLLIQQKLIPLLKDESNLFGKVEIEYLFPELGVRTEKRSKGKYILTEFDVLNSTDFEDSVAIGTWPLEEWNETGKVEITSLNHPYYTIPARCLESNEFDNLFFAGKTISADEKAISSARVMGTCLQTGYAAGKMARATCRAELELTIDSMSKSIRKSCEHY